MSGSDSNKVEFVLADLRPEERYRLPWAGDAANPPGMYAYQKPLGSD